jgi:hypothetical protein
MRFSPRRKRAGYRDGLLSPPTALTDPRVLEAGSTAFLHPRQGRVITDNDLALASKLELIEEARSSLDMMYYAYDDDYSSAVFSEALLAAALRGVRVRLLLDYHTCYKNLDYYLMLEREAGRGAGSLEVRFYNRPTRRLVRDAAYMTLGCGGLSEDRSGCDEAKLRELDRVFAAERIDGRPVTENISNLDVAESGLFLSGPCDKRPDVMALAGCAGTPSWAGSTPAPGRSSTRSKATSPSSPSSSSESRRPNLGLAQLALSAGTGRRRTKRSFQFS